ncbi:MAG: hypothetical protein J5732_03045 [Bacteroidaceae bacterium]|nr:hypothetical protein [Bacteroidaceae bacterium]
MDIGAVAEALMRRKLLEGVCDRMTPDERSLFIQIATQQRDTADVMRALRQQQAQLADLRKHQQTFGEDFLSNVAGNAAYDVLLYLARRLFK